MQLRDPKGSVGVQMYAAIDWSHVKTGVLTDFTDYAGWADKIRGDSYPPEDGFYKIVRQEALGVCAGITAWNASLHFLAWKSAPALACGNTVIIKPSEKSPLGTLSIAPLIKEAGFPPGVFQILPGKRL
jgi:aldehyde dehydrogenase (NAD+)